MYVGSCHRATKQIIDWITNSKMSIRLAAISGTNDKSEAKKAELALGIVDNIAQAVDVLRTDPKSNTCRAALRIILSACATEGAAIARPSSGTDRARAEMPHFSRQQINLGGGKRQEWAGAGGNLEFWEPATRAEYKNKVSVAIKSFGICGVTAGLVEAWLVKGMLVLSLLKWRTRNTAAARWRSACWKAVRLMHGPRHRPFQHTSSTSRIVAIKSAKHSSLSAA